MIFLLDKYKYSKQYHNEMCRLLGVVGSKPTDLSFSLLRADKPFKNLCRANPDGWGLGWYEKKKAKLFKEGIPCAESGRLPVLAKEARSNIIIAHVRLGTGGEPAERNSHPFRYRNWLFAHNGRVDRKHLLNLLQGKFRKEIKGETDSEVYFLWLLQNIEKHKAVIKGARSAVKEIISREYGSLNFLLSDGKKLCAFRYSKSDKEYYSLYVLKRNPSEELGHLKLLSKETKALLQSKSLKRERSVLVCSEKLTREGWKNISFGNLLEIDSELGVREIKVL